MKQKVREPFLITRMINLLLGIAILILLLLHFILKESAEIFRMWIFLLAGVENFIGAVISFAEAKKVRGNIYAVVCAVFLIMALVLAVDYFVFA